MWEEFVGREAADGADDGFDGRVAEGGVDLFAALEDCVREGGWERVEDYFDVVAKAFEEGLCAGYPGGVGSVETSGGRHKSQRVSLT